MTSTFRRAPVSSAVAGLLALALGLAPSVHAATAPAAASAPAPDPAVRIRLSLDDKGQLLVRYQAPPEVMQLSFAQRDARLDEVARGPMMRPADGCGRLVPGGIALKGGKDCAEGATFVVVPKELDAWALYEPAQPTSDGGVLTWTGAWAAVAPGHPLRWEFVAPAGGYVFDEGARQAGPVRREAMAPTGDAPLDEAQLKALHAAHGVYLGRSPVIETDGLSFVRDPALPDALVTTLVSTTRSVVDAYARASGLRPDGPVGVVMIASASTPDRAYRYHGDRNEGRMLRLSFRNVPATLSAHDVAGVQHFVAHEVAHLWNHGVWRSDMAQPWLHEGDAEWTSWTTLARLGALPPGTLQVQLETAVDTCLVARGEAPAATMKADWASRDDPYACGFALQLLAWTRRPSGDGDPLAGWAALHREYPDLTVAQFAAYADAGHASTASPAPAPTANAKSRGKPANAATRPAATRAANDGPTMTTLLQDPRAPFADTYLAALAARVPQLQLSDSEPEAAALRRALAARLFAALSIEDCNGTDFTVRDDDIVLGHDLACRHLPAGRRVEGIAGQPLLAHPMGAWRAAAQDCALHAEVEVSFADARPEKVACPALPPVPRLVRLPDALTASLATPPAR
jgi:hypothetical protein